MFSPAVSACRDSYGSLLFAPTSSIMPDEAHHWGCGVGGEGVYSQDGPAPQHTHEKPLQDSIFSISRPEEVEKAGGGADREGDREGEGEEEEKCTPTAREISADMRGVLSRYVF